MEEKKEGIKQAPLRKNEMKQWAKINYLILEWINKWMCFQCRESLQFWFKRWSMGFGGGGSECGLRAVSSSQTKLTAAVKEMRSLNIHKQRKVRVWTFRKNESTASSIEYINAYINCRVRLWFRCPFAVLWIRCCKPTRPTHYTAWIFSVVNFWIIHCGL
jgi:hypothetical protein